MSTSNEKKKSGHGGARPGAGRPRGSKDNITVGGLLQTLYDKSNGQNYQDILAEDFLVARMSGDTNLTLKYHNLILNKVMNSLARIEVTDSQDAVETKRAAFAEALSRLTESTKEKGK